MLEVTDPFSLRQQCPDTYSRRLLKSHQEIKARLEGEVLRQFFSDLDLGVGIAHSPSHICEASRVDHFCNKLIAFMS